MCCLAGVTCVCTGLYLTNFTSSYFFSGYQQSRYMKALLTVHYWIMKCLIWACVFHEGKKSSKELFANCSISKCYSLWLQNWQRKYILAHKHLQMIIWWAHFIITAGVQRIMVIIFLFIISPGLESLQIKTKENILNNYAKRISTVVQICTVLLWSQKSHVIHTLLKMNW